MRLGGLLFAVVPLLFGCEDTTVVIEDENPDIVIEHVYHTIVEEDTTPDVVIIEDTTPDIIVMEDNTPDVVQEFYSDAADLPVLLWNVGGETPMPKKLRQLNSAVPIKNIVTDDALGVDQDSSGDSMWIKWQDFPLPTNHISGLILSPDAGDPDNDVNVTAGKARDVTDAANMPLATEITKQINAAWVAGDDNGGLDTGSVAASTLYAVWLIKDQTNELVDVLISASFSAPTMPTNYTLKRLIGAVKTDSSADIIPFLHSGDEFVYIGNSATPPPLDISDTAITTVTWVTAALDSVPPLATARISGRAYNAASTGDDGILWVRTPTSSSWSASGNPSAAFFKTDVTGTAFVDMASMGHVLVDSSKQIQYAAWEAGGSTEVYITVFGFVMHTRRDPQ